MRSLIFIIFSFFLLSCKAQNKKNYQSIFNSESIKLNDSAMAIFQRNHSDQGSIQTIITLLEKAIRKDSSYYIAYSNLASMFCYMRRYQDAISTLDKILKINPSLIEIKTTKGFIVEKSGDKLMASEIYKDVQGEYDEKISADSTNIKLKLNRAFLLFFTEGYDQAINEFKRISEGNPNNAEINNIREFFISFNRQSYIESICLN